MFSLTDEEGDGGLKRGEGWAYAKDDVPNVATDLNLWIQSLSVTPSMMNSTTSYYLNKFGKTVDHGVYQIIR